MTDKNKESNTLEKSALLVRSFRLAKLPAARYQNIPVSKPGEPFTKAQKLQIGLSVLGSTIGVSSYLESHRSRKQNESLGKIDQKSLEALQNIHNVLQRKSAKPAPVLVVASDKKTLKSTLKALNSNT